MEGEGGAPAPRRPRTKVSKGVLLHSEPQAAQDSYVHGSHRHLLFPETGPFATSRKGGRRRKKGGGGGGGSGGVSGSFSAGGGLVEQHHSALDYSPEYLDERKLPHFEHKGRIPPGHLFHPLTEAERRSANDNFSIRLAHIRTPSGEPTLLSFTKLCALKTSAMDLWVERGWELSTVALAFVAFERCVLAGHVVKANRKLYMAVCLLLAWKMNESREGGEEEEKTEGSPKTTVGSALAAKFGVDWGAIKALEFQVFVQLSFALHMKVKQQISPLLERILGAVGGGQGC